MNATWLLERSKLLRRVAAPFLAERYRIVMFGPSDSGKTTFLYRLKLGIDHPVAIPTTNFNCEHLHLSRDCVITLWDIGGTPAMQPLITEFIYPLEASNIASVDQNMTKKADGVFLCVPDWRAVPFETIDVLNKMRRAGTLRVPVLVLLSVYDEDLADLQTRVAETDPTGQRTASLSPEDVANALDLHSLEVPWIVRPVNVWSGEGVEAALRWITKAMVLTRHKHLDRGLDEDLAKFFQKADSCADGGAAL